MLFNIALLQSTKNNHVVVLERLLSHIEQEHCAGDPGDPGDLGFLHGAGCLLRCFLRYEDKRGVTLLHWIALSGNLQMFQVLLGFSHNHYAMPLNIFHNVQAAARLCDCSWPWERERPFQCVAFHGHGALLEAFLQLENVDPSSDDNLAIRCASKKACGEFVASMWGRGPHSQR